MTTNTGGLIEFFAVKRVVGNFETSVVGVTKFFSTYGVFNVSGMKLVSAPSSEQYVTLRVMDAVDLNKPTALAYLKSAY